jgi:hypothetical protein
MVKENVSMINLNLSIKSIILRITILFLLVFGNGNSPDTLVY